LSWKPRIFRLHNLLTAEECDGLVALGRPELEASTVVDTATGEGMLSQVRTSQGMFITDNTPLTLLIRKRIAHITLLPEENQEAISVLRYQKGAFYRPHQDFFADQTNINRGGQRTAVRCMQKRAYKSGTLTHACLRVRRCSFI
jgi:prolyl 4-hydroxylase